MAASLHCLSSRMPGKASPFLLGQDGGPEGEVQIQTCDGGEKIMGSNYCSLIQLIKLIYAMSGISYQNKSVNTGN